MNEPENNNTGFCCIFGSSNKKDKSKEKKFLSNKERKIKKQALKDIERLGNI